MNRTVQRIEELNAQLATLDKILARGEYLAAGLDVTINVGPLGDGEPDLRFELSWYVETILPDIRKSLAQSRAMWLMSAKGELDELHQALMRNNP